MDGLSMKVGTNGQDVTAVTVFGSITAAFENALKTLNQRLGLKVNEGKTAGDAAEGAVVVLDADVANKDDLIALADRTHVVVMANVTDVNVAALANAGVAALVPASTGPERLALVLELVARGGQCWSTEAVATSIAALPGHAESVVGVDRIPSLTRRQRDVLNLVAKGKSNQAIGDLLGLNLSTVKGHVRGIFTTLGVRNRTQAVLALQHAVSRGVA